MIDAVMNTPADYRLHPIGWVRSSLKQRAGAPKQGYERAPDAWLEIEPAFVRGLHLMEVGEHIVILTWLHQAGRDVLEVHPRGMRPFR